MTKYTKDEVDRQWSQFMRTNGKWLLAEASFNTFSGALNKVVMIAIVFKLFTVEQLALREMILPIMGGLVTFIIVTKAIQHISLRCMFWINLAGYAIYLAWLVDPLYWLISGAIWNGLANPLCNLWFRQINARNVHDAIRVRWGNWSSVACESGYAIGAFVAGLVITDQTNPIVTLIILGVIMDINLSITFYRVWKGKLKI
jgi:hypothetical protein